jgi:hypothetical protein
MKKILYVLVGFVSLSALANMAQFPMMAGQGMPGQMISPNQGVAMDPGAYQSPYQGMGDIPPYAINQNHLCQQGRFANTNQFNFGPNQQMPGMPGMHQ